MYSILIAIELIRDINILCYIICLQDYVEVLKEVLSTGFNAVKFFKKTEFTYIQRKRAEEALFNALEAIVSENGEQAVIAQKLLINFSEVVNSTIALRFWNGLRIREEKANTRIAQIILQEKEVSYLHFNK